MINIKEISLSLDFAKTAFENENNSRKANGKRNSKKYSDYCKAIQVMKEFITDDRGTATADDPNEKFSYHMALIKLKEDEFSKSEIAKLFEILSVFDNVLFIGDNEGNISISLLIDDIYDTMS